MKKIFLFLVFLLIAIQYGNGQTIKRIQPENENIHLVETENYLLDIKDTALFEYFTLLNLGMAECNNANYELALNYFNKAIEINQTIYKGYQNRSTAYSKLNRYEEAFADVSKAIELAPNNYQPYYNRGVFYRDLHQPDLAITDFQKVLKLNPDFAYSHFYMGECYFMKGDLSLSIENFNKAIKLDSSNVDFYYSRSVYYANIKDLENELLDLKKVLSLDPKHSSALNNLGFQYYNNFKDFNKAVYYYSEAIKYDPSDLRCRANRARVYQELKEYLKAIDDITYAIITAPNEKFFYKRRFELYTLIGQLDKASIDLAKYTELNNK